MDTDTIQIEIPAIGNSITIVLRNPWYNFDKDEVTVFESRDFPKCDWCETDLEEAESDDDWQEKWVCPICQDEHYFSWGVYGEDEVTLSREEWETKCSLENQRMLLRKRYGTPHPKSITDYWLAKS